jgi:hypothetical protein
MAVLNSSHHVATSPALCDVQQLMQANEQLSGCMESAWMTAIHFSTVSRGRYSQDLAVGGADLSDTIPTWK